MYSSILKTDQLLFLLFFTFLMIIWKRVKHEKIVVLIFSFLFSYYIFGPNFKAKFWLIDDHEIFYFLGSAVDPKGWGDFFSILIDQTEVGLFGVSTRYRPSYYFLRLVEVFLWKDNATLWYLFRFLILVSFVYSIILIFRYFLSTPVALAWIFTCFSFTYWSDIYSRLGPGETYVTLGVAMFILSTFNWEKKVSRSLGVTILQVLSLVIMIGSKENMFLVAMLPFLFLYDRSAERYKFKYYHLLYVLPILFSVVVVYAVIKALSLNPVDVNGNSAQISDRIRQIFGLMNNPLILQPTILGALLVIVLIVRRKIVQFLATYRQILFILFFLMINIILNIVFYGGDLPQNNRYDFPTSILYILYFIIIVGIIMRLLFQRKKIKKGLFVGFVFLIFSSIGFSSYSINEIQNASRKNTKRTLALNQMIGKMQLEPKDSTGIIYVRNFTEFEPADSFLQYAKYYNLQLRLALDVDEVKYYSSFQDGLMWYLRNLSIHGNKEKNLKPLGDLKKDKGVNCILYHFGELSFVAIEKYTFCKQINLQLISY
ncbi:hypothetical protein [Leptospira vanthielii]|uniref:Glycosyltransferase RgtA/B/C/D-like domain-containing protein n=1 Tax=Leptospira vanthielii TaxID=293085 RepID=A0ABY2NSQ8_9LEPT|nr:hypothetical protein [Leptospira vanthielii]TGM60650.1 hypothetical protein EHQ95_01885 [Leptospira vanthielii]